jgi:hypothetical protein
MRDTSRPHAHASPVPSPAAPDVRRRRFLLGRTAGGAAAVAAAAPAGAATIASPEEILPADASGYQETAHVRQYYATTRL